MRLDKFLCELNKGSRSQVKELIRLGNVTVNGQVVRNAACQIKEEEDVMTLYGETLVFQKFVYYMLNKPSGVISATKDPISRTVLDLLGPDLRKGMFPVGRLDKDTEGLLLITNDGELSHRLLSPKRHVDKVYLAEIAAPLTEEDIRALEQGVDIGEETPTLPAKVEVLEERLIKLILHEGQYHQVKRMLTAVGNEVRTLKRVRFGKLSLDLSLAPGAHRILTDEEVELLRES
ncbi:MAG: rRNA pseudouridine synthase [Candidatus Gastranaerophilales bacterium]|nr:rRNA pseudouridine synthase [Candidatus Gastranaerophilales bacterium]